jgi:hypothetical protein|tara:strand:+ start:350 stop:484 length:135 start_codon:yes stop_codon:yes gene_type:complete
MNTEAKLIFFEIKINNISYQNKKIENPCIFGRNQKHPIPPLNYE